MILAAHPGGPVMSPERAVSHSDQVGHHDPSRSGVSLSHVSGSMCKSSALRCRTRKVRRGWPGSETMPALCPPLVSAKLTSVSLSMSILKADRQGAT